MEHTGKSVFEDAREPAEGARGRDSLLLMAQLRVSDGAEPVAVRVRNLSPGGLMAELPQPLPTDRELQIEVRGIGWITGRVAWQTEGRAGIAFDEEIDPQRARKPVAVKGGRRTFALPTAR